MNFSVISEGEAIVMYRDAKYKSDQIKVIADLLCCTEEDVRELLTSHGCEVPGKKRAHGRRCKWLPEEIDIAQRMFDGGASCEQICQVLGHPVSSVRGRLIQSGRYFKKRRI